MNSPEIDPKRRDDTRPATLNTTAGKAKLVLLSLLGIVCVIVIAYAMGMITLGFGHRESHAYQTRGTLEAVCDVVVQRPVDGLDQPFETSKLPLPVVIDFDEMTGAYAGEYAISMNRKGTLHAKGDKLEIVRQAMFKRHNITIQGEAAELDRKTGEFRQWLELGNDKRLYLMAGKCRRKDNTPF
jgi:hypothetical protein